MDILDKFAAVSMQIGMIEYQRKVIHVTGMQISSNCKPYKALSGLTSTVFEFRKGKLILQYSSNFQP